MTTGAALNTYVFLFAFASMFLLGAKRPLLALSTRLLLVVLLGLGITYMAEPNAWFHGHVGVATLIANALFVGFAAIDFLNWQKKRAAEGG
jgi:hypothetical protein